MPAGSRSLGLAFFRSHPALERPHRQHGHDDARGKLRHIGVGRTHARTHIIMLVHDLHVRIINAATGELLRELVIDLTQDYQPTGTPPGPAPGTPRPPRRAQK